MEIALNCIGETLTLMGTALLVDNENSDDTSIYLEDISQLEDKRLYNKVIELELMSA